MSEPLILGFDTSAAHCAAALLRGEELVAERYEEMSRGQAERLMPLLEEILAGQGIGWRDLTAIGVGVGPGNFTGIRISVSAARGLALALDIPAIGVSTFEALRFGQDGTMITAVKGPADKTYVQVGEAAPVLCGPEEMPDYPSKAEPVLLAYPSADALSLKAELNEIQPCYPLAEAIARKALARRFNQIEPPAPLYIKAADAAPSRDAPPVMLDDA
ncbi:tRNA (adenosine(37)-N6)-threonylcarbamoyltransferase complex dimerization subunit type 1 TsaB [Roseovarius albus]|uniref:tRNA (adenosine(37)-N6)-threonylcarbamoyltransferase complex dimerization subunit type 1 TsaB n=1 Tax=Roseovarius albus TaxID=1247867 RepID=UPI00279595D8|nr:tRNA (adenosine(37)-N6)-threonylcarbamoyltransferase complex dimerization subunit type 1 TsaB [Roseovarius albus]